MLEPLSGHAVFLLLVQLTLLLVAARFGSEIAQRLGLPSVVGELAAGIVLGPTVLGHFSPELFALVFPQDVHQFHMLEVVGMLGMVLLLLLTGLETDLRLLKNLGRAALIASFMGMAVPFATGYGLGLWMPDAYLAQPDKRMLFSFFLATAMSISAMPVIAKMLMDLDLTKRNIGLVILSAGVIDDTAGWLILSVIAGAARHGGEVQVGNLVSTVLLTGAFVGVAAFAIYPISRGIIRIANRNFKTDDADLLFLLVITFACAAATEWIGIHAVFGAFVAGTLFRQVTHLKAETVHRLESFVFTVLAPIFFGVVGLKVDLWKLGGGQMLGIVLAVACLGKLIGCTIGSMWGGLRFWEGLSIAVAMNARGAMELVVATIGLSLGILNQEMFSIIVVVAVVTSFLAPLGLRLTMRMVRMTQEEVQRMVAEQTKGLFDPETLRVLLPTTGFSNAGAVMLAAGIAKRSVNPVDVLLIETETPWWSRFIPFRTSRSKSHAVNETAAREQLVQVGLAQSVRTLHHHNVAQAVLNESQKDKDIIVLGASRRGDSLGGPILEAIVQGAPCHVVIVKEPKRLSIPNTPFQNLLVPYDGGVFARAAVELAVRYAEVSGARVTLAMVSEQPPTMGLPPDETTPVEAMMATSPEELIRVSTVFHSTSIKPSILRLSYGLHSSALIEEATSGRYDLVILGAENRAVQNRLFFGYDNERLIGNDAVVVAVVVPNVTMLTKDRGLTKQLSLDRLNHGSVA